MNESSTSMADSGDHDDTLSFNCPKDYKTENVNLLKANNDLTNQLTNIRNQYDQALLLTSKVESITNTNRQYAKEITDLKMEKEDYQRRLQLALQNNQDLSNKFQYLKDNQAQNNESSFLPNSISSTFAEKTISELKLSLDIACKEKDKIQQELHQDHIIFNNVFQAASQYFHSTIDSPQSLIDCFSTKSDKKVEKNNDFSKNCVKLCRKLKKKQQIINSQHADLCELEKTIDNLIKEGNQQKLELTTQINDLSNRNKELEIQVEDLSKKNEAYLQDITQKNSKIKYNAIENDDLKSKENQKLNIELSALKISYDKHLQKYKKLKKNYLGIVCEHKSLIMQCDTYEDSLKNIEIKKTELKKERQENIVIQKKYEFQIKDMENSVLRAQDEISLQKKQQDALKDEISQFKDRIKKMERDYKELQAERDNLITENLKHDNQVQMYETKLSIASDLQAKTEKQLNDALHPSDAQSMIPSSLLNSPDFPNDLQSAIGEIARNTALHISVRIQSVFSTIAKWYRAYSEQSNQEICNEKQKYNILRVQTDTLLDFLKRSMPNVKINFDLLLSDEHTRNFFGDSINDLREVQRLRPQIEELKTILHVTKFEDCKEAIISLNKTYSTYHKRSKNIKVQRKKMCRIFENKIEEMNQTIEELTAKNDNLRIKCSESDDKNHDLQNHISSLETSYNKEINECKKIHENKIAELKQTCIDMQNQLQELENLKDIVIKTTKKKEKLEGELQTAKNEKEEAERKYKLKIKAEKERFTHICEQIKKQATDSQNSVQELTQKNLKLVATNETLSAQNNEMILKIQKLETKATAAQSEFEQEKKAIESKINAKILMTETEYRSKIEEKQIQVDIVKKRMADSISRFFTSYLDGLRIDENNFEGALQVVKKKIDDVLAREIRLKNILKVDSRVSLEDAIYSLTRKGRRRNSINMY